jgi:chromosome segregation ATPase
VIQFPIVIEKTNIANDLRRLKEEVKEAKLKLETETNARNKAEMELDNNNRRLASQDVDFKNKHLSVVKEMTSLAEIKKKLEAQNAQATKKLSDMEIVNKQLQVKLKEVEKKLNSAYRLSKKVYGI